jgi:methylglutaconyl-CoA hydratase
MNLQTISVEISPRRVATIALNRPDRGNAFDQTTLDELAAQLGALGGDANVRVVVLRGNGRHFCTGADLAPRSPDAHASGEPAKPPAALRDVLAALDTCPKPTIAVVHGAAVGGGAAFAACCDVALAGDRAFFSIPEVRVGMPPLGVMPFLVRAIGHRNFRRYGLTGERISANDALRIGLVHQVCETVELDDALTRVTDELLHGAPGAISMLKSAAAEYSAPTLSAILANKATHDPKSAEALEGVASFREKRKPSWYPK